MEDLEVGRLAETIQVRLKYSRGQQQGRGGSRRSENRSRRVQWLQEGVGDKRIKLTSRSWKRQGNILKASELLANTLISVQ